MPKRIRSALSPGENPTRAPRPVVSEAVAQRAPVRDRGVRTGLRYEKKRRLASKTQRVALKLFVSQGYETTTIEQIARAVHVSPMTIYRYFPQKEDLVFHNEYQELIVESILADASGPTRAAALRRSLTAVLARVFADRSMLLAKGRLMLRVPALRARLWDLLDRGETALCQALAAETSHNASDFRVRVAAGATMGAIKVALVRWIEMNGEEDIAGLVDRALEELGNGIIQ